MIRTNYYDENKFNAFRDNESKIITDDRELDEFDPENLDPDMKIFNTDDDD